MATRTPLYRTCQGIRSDNHKGCCSRNQVVFTRAWDLWLCADCRRVFSEAELDNTANGKKIRRLLKLARDRKLK
jgi:hypothetical protein